MSDHDRYSRDEKPLSFDARRPVRGERAVPVAFLVSAGILIVLVVAIVFAYRSGVRGSDEAPMAVGEPVGEFKAPAPADANADPAAGLQIYSETDGAPPAQQPTFAAPPEEPQPRPAPQVQTPAPVPAAKAVQPASQTPAAKAAPTPSSVIANLPPGALPSTPAPKAAAPATTPVPSGGVNVQVGAFSSPALAQRGWNDAVRLAPGAAAGKGQAVEEANVNGRTVYRSLVTGFDNRAAAQSFCATITAAGGNCLVR